MKPALKIISGGQTGVDRAALEWAVANDVPHGGWCPKGRKAEDGVIPDRFQMSETGSTHYAFRTRRNIQDSGATVIFSRQSELTGGTKLTAEIAKKVGKPLLQIFSDAGAENAARDLQNFIREHEVVVLNVAGPRASSEPEIASFVKLVLSLALKPDRR
jgi:putative molybdenum carrier protein